MQYQDDRSVRRWTTILVFVVGLLATIAVWHTLRTHEQSELNWATKLAAEAIRTDLVTDMDWQIVGLDRLAMLWEAADPAQQLWTRNAELYIQHRTGCVAVEWLSPNGERRVVVRAGGQMNARPLAFGGMPKALIEAVTKSKVAMISAPEAVSDGSKQWVIAYPVYASGQPRGFIVTFFDVEPTLNFILNDVRPLDFSFGVLQPNQPEFVLPGTNRKHEQEWGAVVNVPLSGVTWQLRVWPNADVVNEIRSRLPEVALAVGSVLSLLLALTLYFGTGAVRASARTRLVNDALQREISIREGAQEELRRAHAELEMRIDRRTAELAAANALLQKEATEHQQAEEMLRELTGQLFHSQDEERRRLARELHDGATQNLIALAMNMATMRERSLSADEQTELLNDSVRLIQRSIGELRTTSHLLHPPLIDELGLPVTLRSYVDGFSARSGIRVSVTVDPQLGRLNRDVELGIFRVVQESLANVHRHSHSDTASILLCREHAYIRLEVSDEGTGIPPDVLSRTEHGVAGVGIAGMRERVRLLGGRFEVDSGNSGTTIRILLPVTKTKPSDQLAVSA